MSKAELTSNPKKKLGRPRNVATQQAILVAARDLLEEVGPSRLTMEAVAKRAGVGKPTLYRGWANAQELAMAALVQREETVHAAPSLSLERLIENIILRLNTKRGRQMALMLASAEPDGELFKAFANRVILQGRQEAYSILQEMVLAQQLRSDADLGVILDMIFGAIMLRLLLRHEPLDADLAQKVLAVVFEAEATEAAPEKRF